MDWGARTKLNLAYWNGALMIVAIAGSLFQSLWVIGLVLVMVMGGADWLGWNPIPAT